MNRRAALALSTAFLACPVSAASPSTIVAVACNDPGLEEEAEDFLAGELSVRHVHVVDPSAIDVTLHQRARSQVTQVFGGLAFDYAALSWITVRYHAERMLAVMARFTVQSLPYGAFTVYNTRARCSYRCFDVQSKTIVAAGSALGTGQSEDLTTSQEQALHVGLEEIARQSGSRLV